MPHRSANLEQADPVLKGHIMSGLIRDSRRRRRRWRFKPISSGWCQLQLLFAGAGVARSVCACVTTAAWLTTEVPSSHSSPLQSPAAPYCRGGSPQSTASPHRGTQDAAHCWIRVAPTLTRSPKSVQKPQRKEGRQKGQPSAERPSINRNPMPRPRPYSALGAHRHNPRCQCKSRTRR